MAMELLRRADGDVVMRSSAAFVAIEPQIDSGRDSTDLRSRTLVEMIGKISSELGVESAAGSGSEEILVDTEVDGSRYLLLRMPKRNSRVQLSPREQEIVRMVAKGHPNKVIADVLNISSWTVCTHLRRIFAKLGVGSRAAMVAQLLESGLLSHENRAPGGVR
jgi:DNA-binding CsgD family transcriptional regulator